MNDLVKLFTDIESWNIGRMKNLSYNQFMKHLEEKYYVTLKEHDSKPVNVSDEQSITDDDLALGIEVILHKNLNHRLDAFSLKLFEQVAKDIVDLVKNCKLNKEKA
jgi:hypothetical protein